MKNSAVILAAGVASRLRPLSLQKPKCLVEVSGNPIIKYQLDALLDSGINSVIVVTGHLSPQIEEFIEREYGSCRKIFTIRNDEYTSTENMYSLWIALRHLSSCHFPFDYLLVINGDVVVERRLIEYALNSSLGSSIFIDNSFWAEEAMKIKIDLEGDVVDISKKIRKEETYSIYMEMLKFDKMQVEVLGKIIERDFIAKGVLNQWPSKAILRGLESKKLNMSLCDISGYLWSEVDYIEDIMAAESQMKIPHF
jgi:choline kinase